MSRLLAITASLVVVLSGCSRTDNDSAQNPTAGLTLDVDYKQAREIERAEGFVAALPLFEASARGGNGFSAALLWDYYATNGDSETADEFRALAFENAGERAWKYWAATANAPTFNAKLKLSVERLQQGVAEGSELAQAELDRVVDALETEASSGNESARFSLEMLSAEVL